MMGYPVLYAAAKVKDGYGRADGRHFNMSYLPGKILEPESEIQVITYQPEKDEP